MKNKKNQVHVHFCLGCSGTWECADNKCLMPRLSGCGHAYGTDCGITFESINDWNISKDNVVTLRLREDDVNTEVML